MGSWIPFYLSSLYIFFTLFLLSLPISIRFLSSFPLYLPSLFSFLPSLLPFYLPSHPLIHLFLPSLSIFHSLLFLFPLYILPKLFSFLPFLSFVFLSIFSLSIPIPPLQLIPLYLPILLISPSLLFHRSLYTVCLTTPVYRSFLFSLQIAFTSVSLCVTDNCSMMKIIHPSFNQLFSLFIISLFQPLFTFSFPSYIKYHPSIRSQNRKTASSKFTNLFYYLPAKCHQKHFHSGRPPNQTQTQPHQTKLIHTKPKSTTPN